ncbi:fibrinogen C domain-containing protein 1-like [Branchiostoma floridae]|uniref:Fibrinogen C domain-containing protein 1-like n=1 Tax=Branchiostoma floridae TaxID=7739 RepID=A0A9J7LT20_BRAFL|nr:fibrinogen C domain-containing protein 1-like [Branchiostoma floridae]
MSKVVLLALLALLQQGGAANIKNLPEIVHHETAGGGSEVTGQITLHCPAQPAPSCPALDHLLLFLSTQDSLEGQIEQLKNRTDSLDRQLQQLAPQDLAEFQATIEALQATVSSQDSIIQQQAAALQQLQETLQQLEATNQQQASMLQQLETTNQQQATTIQQHTNSLQQLEATNQQQASNLQQLEATNQQQASSLQQLEATNQQHAISLQQLDATNQQQVSSLQQLEVTNQQQAKSLQQLETTNQQQGSNLQQLNTTIQQQGTALLQQEETLQQQEETLQQQANAIHQQATTLQQCTTNLQQLEDKVAGPQSCNELLNSGHNTSGVYTLYPVGEVTSPIHVYCDMDADGGGWTVIQRRKDGSVDFYLDWQNYKTGFGDLGGEFWLGNDNLHHLTAQGGYELRVDLEDFEGNSTYAKYSNFSVEDEGHLYRLTVEGYSGTAGNSMARHSSMCFSTKDKENDIRESFDCAQAYKGGWWYSNCHTANLNGLYHGGDHQSYADGVNWKSWKGYHYSLKHTEMKIRPR